jgi:LysR family transcriptional regulator, glycine cleavage system transcriptional activator
MSYRLPPLNGLRAFEVAARHVSFTHAASELYLTRGAVAQQVKKLEDALGQKLFYRRRNRLTLTPAGERYFTRVTSAFRALSHATEEIAPALKGRMFRLGVAPELVRPHSKLARLLSAPPPSLRLRVVNAPDLTLLYDGKVDAVLHASDGPCPGYNVEAVSLEHLDIDVPAVRLVTQPGLAGCREQHALIRLLRT